MNHFIDLYHYFSREGLSEENREKIKKIINIIIKKNFDLFKNNYCIELVGVSHLRNQQYFSTNQIFDRLR